MDVSIAMEVMVACPCITGKLCHVYANYKAIEKLPVQPPPLFLDPGPNSLHTCLLQLHELQC